MLLFKMSWVYLKRMLFNICILFHYCTKLKRINDMLYKKCFHIKEDSTLSEKRYIPTPNLAYCADYDEHSEEYKNCKNQSVDITIAIILQECVAFYDVFKGLEKRLKNNGMIEILPEHNNPTLLEVPYIVNGAFACELALKYLLIKNQISFCISAKGHNLEYLFNLLPFSIKQSLKTKLKIAGNINETELAENIHLHADSFNQWRYMFANKSNNMHYNKFFGIFVNQLCSFVLSQ